MFLYFNIYMERFQNAKAKLLPTISPLSLNASLTSPCPKGEILLCTGRVQDSASLCWLCSLHFYFTSLPPLFHMSHFFQLCPNIFSVYRFHLKYATIKWGHKMAPNKLKLLRILTIFPESYFLVFLLISCFQDIF